MDEKKILIKKYENRRLYDTANSRYVNLEEVAQFVQSGKDVQVVDAATGEDITRLILTQIIVEDAKAPDSSFPLDVLKHMVISSGRAGQESTMKYMNAIVDLYQSAYRAIPSPLNPFGLLPNLANMRPPAPEGPSSSPAPAAEPTEAGPRENPEVQDLKRRIGELESLVSKLGRAPRARKKKPKSRS
jgi:polyhydroxyalkanoate synthesis repressor PhaR